MSIMLLACVATNIWQTNAIGQDAGKEGSKESTNVPSASGPIKKNLVLKPYLVFGYNLQEVFTRSNIATDTFFTDLSKFHNWRVGLGLRITSFFGIEAIYTSLARTYTATDADFAKAGQAPAPSNKHIDMFSHVFYFTGTFYTPPIDIKFGTIEFFASAGIAGLFGLSHTSEDTRLGYLFSAKDSPQFVMGAGIILGFPKLISIKGFVELLTLGDTHVINMPIAMNYGVVINIYLL